jgi:hypothetical protein
MGTNTSPLPAESADTVASFTGAGLAFGFAFLSLCFAGRCFFSTDPLESLELAGAVLIEGVSDDGEDVDPPDPEEESSEWW